MAFCLAMIFSRVKRASPYVVVVVVIVVVVDDVDVDFIVEVVSKITVKNE